MVVRVRARRQERRRGLKDDVSLKAQRHRIQLRGWSNFGGDSVRFSCLPLAWAELSLRPQVNATVATANVADRLEVSNSFSLGLPATLAGSGAGPAVLDAWGYPFGYWKRGRCFVLVSYGSDGKPDASDYEGRLCESAMHASTCWWPAMDTVFCQRKTVACLPALSLLRLALRHA